MTLFHHRSKIIVIVALAMMLVVTGCTKSILETEMSFTDEETFLIEAQKIRDLMKEEDRPIVEDFASVFGDEDIRLYFGYKGTLRDLILLGARDEIANLDIWIPDMEKDLAGDSDRNEAIRATTVTPIDLTYAKGSFRSPVIVGRVKVTNGTNLKLSSVPYETALFSNGDLIAAPRKPSGPRGLSLSQKSIRLDPVLGPMEARELDLKLDDSGRAVAHLFTPRALNAPNTEFKFRAVGVCNDALKCAYLTDEDTDRENIEAAKERLTGLKEIIDRYAVG